MTDDTATGTGQGPGPGGLTILCQRADFLRASRARRQAMPGFVLQARRRAEGEAEGLRIGFTCSKKVGNAVARNRAKRRLRAIARDVLQGHGQDGWDYVLIGRAGATANRPYDALRSDLTTALAKLHAPRVSRDTPGSTEQKAAQRAPE